MKEIKLTRGYVTVVDDEDYEWLSKYKWHVMTNGEHSYAVRQVDKKYIFMHRLILGAEGRDNLVDHKDLDGLNNQRSNLRLATHSQNNSNRRDRGNKSSKYHGVSWHKKDKTWQAQISYNWKKFGLVATPVRKMLH